MNVARLAIAGFLAFVITAGLIILMSALITQDIKPPEDDDGTKIADIHMPERAIETQYDAEKPEKPEEPEEQPDMPEPEFETPDITPDSMSMSAPRMNLNPSIKGIGGFGGDGEYLPIVKVQPVYPRRALSRGIEGYVIVEFTVTTNGSVRDAVVIESNPQKVFDRAATKAALKFKYKPRVIDGEAVEVPGVRNKITFAIAK